MDYYNLKRNDAINLADLMYLEANINYTLFYMSDGTKVLSSLTLKRHQEKLSEWKFLRVNRTHLVNQNFVKEIKTKNETSFLGMTDGREFRVSRRRRDTLSQLA